MKTFRGEFHLHTVMSPCAELEMLPPLIVDEAVERGLDFIAITDHNHSGNVESVMQAASGTRLHVFPGMELQSKEEVHLLCIFDTLEQVKALQAYVDDKLPSLKNNPDIFGQQIAVDKEGEFSYVEDKLLATSVNLTVNEVWNIVQDLGGLLIPAHVDKHANGMIPILGFIPQDIPFTALEVSRNLGLAKAKLKYPQLNKYPLLLGGDAHRLEDILGANTFVVEELSIRELQLAFKSQDGRSLAVLS